MFGVSAMIPQRGILAFMFGMFCVQLVAASFEDYYNLDDYDYDYGAKIRAPDCLVDDKGVSTLNGTACDLIVAGNDPSIAHLPGGVLGTYKYVNCQNGRPSYKRDHVDGELTTLFLTYSIYWGDWDIVNSSIISDENVLGYGGGGFGEMRPEDVLEADWYILKDLVANQDDPNDFVNAKSLTVKCTAEPRDAANPGNCSDGIMNGDEAGVDCGGAHCPPCVRLADQMDAIEALREKLRKEYDEKQRESQMTGIAKAAIVIIALIGAAIVCGGPLIYIFRSVGGGARGGKYQQLPVLSRPKTAAK